MKKIMLAIALAMTALTAQAAQPVTAENSFVHGQYTFRDTMAGQHGEPNRNGINLTAGRNLGNGIVLDAGMQVRNEVGDSGQDTSRLEGGATINYGLSKDFTVYTRGAIGYKLTNDKDFTYYSVEPGIAYQVADPLLVRVGYRYRDSFSQSHFDKSNTVRVGAEYALNKNNALTLGLDRSYGDSEFLGVNVGYLVKF